MLHVTNVTTSLDSRSVAQIIQNSSPILFFIKNRPAVWPTFFFANFNYEVEQLGMKIS